MIGFGQVYIPDANFKAYLVGNSAINTNGDSEIQVSEATAFNGAIECQTLFISDLTGIENFTALTDLSCDNNQLISLDVSANTALTDLHCGYNQLTSLDLITNVALDDLTCWNNQLTSLDISGATALTKLNCDNNQLTSLDVSNNTALTSLFSSDNQLTNLDLNQNTFLVVLYCNGNQIISINTGSNTALTEFDCHNNLLTSLDVSNNTTLIYLWCNNNLLTSLDVRNGNNTNFIYFDTQDNPNLTCIDVDDSTWSTTNWNNLDAQHYFSNNCNPSAIQEHTTNKELLKVTDLLGRETKQTNQPLFYIYDDGTVEKRIVMD